MIEPRRRAPGIRALGLGAALLLGACASPSETLTQPTPSVSVTEPSPDPSPSPTAPEPSPSPTPDGWKLTRFDHPEGLYSVSFPRGWSVEDQGGNSLSVVAKNFLVASAHGFERSDVKVDVGLAESRELSNSSATDKALMVDGMAGSYRLQGEDELDSSWSGSGAALVGWAVFELEQPEQSYRGIGISFVAGRDDEATRDLFLQILRSLDVHR